MSIPAPKSPVPTVTMPEPIDIGSWEVDVYPVGEVVRVQLRKGLMCRYTTGFRPPGDCYVYPPNWLERWWGITWEQKVDAAKKRAWQVADKMNAAEQAAKDICPDYNPPTRLPRPTAKHPPPPIRGGDR